MPGEQMQIELFGPRHQHQVRALVLAGLEERWGSIDASLNRDLDDIATSYATGCVLVALHDGMVIGTGAVVPRDLDTAEIVRVSVAPSARRTGLGRTLVDALVEVARSWSVRRVICETSSDWASAVEFYLHCGFRIDHEEDADFGQDTHFSRSLE